MTTCVALLGADAAVLELGAVEVVGVAGAEVTLTLELEVLLELELPQPLAKTLAITTITAAQFVTPSFFISYLQVLSLS